MAVPPANTLMSVTTIRSTNSKAFLTAFERGGGFMEYSGRNQEEIENYTRDDIVLRFLTGADAMAKLRYRNLDEMIRPKQQGKNIMK